LTNQINLLEDVSVENEAPLVVFLHQK